ncbi:N-6 DNA methylase [Candidatus Pelagibacter sp. HIMB1748]|uniref:N-6 DNA methylase n=1 Tax=unclassified Candidatus Pelagibacter TaxID=2647897 RepID=UPI003F837846
MLDDVTKKRINTLRQILVGKLPDPKAQVEQITNGLIYKFMNDMDEQSVSLGGKKSYFSGKFEKYCWKNLMNSKTSGSDRFELYKDAIEKMYNNENLPELFREIFKNSFLPFKDPSTLNMFLKEINEFNYSHSEKLGDAFEYLLSFMGSQGDAGQFRTPRHIIDFIVEIVNPQKNETILDPACGTAGFLISSYKHILKQNTKKNLGDGLTASDRKKIGENLNGYDISPDMVKMSLVNMYLHKFTNPKINEYDTLSSEDRWNEYYDVILANPPFFSPKGGITPHNRFGVKSTKAEVLFIDYINEHLKPNGRAGIIVPEGIIFQRGNAYKQLRKNLIDTSLTAIISLPEGIFNPYSGVKTSIFILDKEKSKKTENIIFIKINNDGFDLGANRKRIDENDLPIIIDEFKKSKFNNPLIKKIKKKKIITEDYSLDINQYIDIKENNSSYELININELVEFERGETITKKTAKPGRIPVIAGGKKISYYHSKSNRQGFTITISSSGDAGYISSHNEPIFVSDAFTIKSNSKKLDDKFLYYILKFKQKNIYEMQEGVAQKHVYPRNFRNFKIPVPNMDTQIQIIEELNDYQKIIDGCEQVIENYKPSINIDTKWERFELDKLVIKFQNGMNFSKEQKGEIVKTIGVTCIKDNLGEIIVKEMGEIKAPRNEIERYKVNKNDILLVRSSGTSSRIGFPGIVDDYGFEAVFTGFVIRIIPNTKIILPKFLCYYLMNSKIRNKIIGYGNKVNISNLSQEKLRYLKLHIPSIEIQKQEVNRIENEIKFINNNKQLLNNFNNRLNNTINKIWSN